MTDRIKGLVVTLDADVREDDVETLCQAILHFRGVVTVSKNVTDINDHINRQRIRSEIQQAVYDALNAKV